MTTELEARRAYQALLTSLEDQGAYGYAEANSGSYYIAFKNPDVGAIRISDHPGHRPYRYPWQVWIGRTGVWTTTRHDGRRVKNYGADRLDMLVRDIRRRRRNLRRRPKEAHVDSLG